MKNLNQSGQALFESLIALPLLITASGAILIGLYNFFSNSVLNHWVYESVLCNAKFESEVPCLQQLNSRVRLLPFIQSPTLVSRNNSREFAVELRFENSLGQMNEIRKKIPRDLNANDFKGRK